MRCRAHRPMRLPRSRSQGARKADADHVCLGCCRTEREVIGFEGPAWLMHRS